MKYYLLDYKIFYDYHFAYGEYYDEPIYSNAKHCENCDRTLTSLKWKPPYNIKVSKSKIGDLIQGTYDNFIISENFKDIYLNHNLKGIESFNKVKIYFRKKELNEIYFYANVVLSNVRIDIKKSNIQFSETDLEYCDVCQNKDIISDMDGIFFENEDKINLDIFHTKLIPSPFFSERIVEIIQKYNFTNFNFEEISNYKLSWLRKRE